MAGRAAVRNRGEWRPAAALPVARVAVDVPLAHLDRPFDYAVPEHLDAAAGVGVRVRVRFAGRLVDGFVLERVAASEHSGRLAWLEKVVSTEQALPPEIAVLCRAVADRYGGVLADVLRVALPPRHARVEAEAVRSPGTVGAAPPAEAGSAVGGQAATADGAASAGVAEAPGPVGAAAADSGEAPHSGTPRSRDGGVGAVAAKPVGGPNPGAQRSEDGGGVGRRQTQRGCARTGCPAKAVPRQRCARRAVAGWGPWPPRAGEVVPRQRRRRGAASRQMPPRAATVRVRPRRVRRPRSPRVVGQRGGPGTRAVRRSSAPWVRAAPRTPSGRPCPARPGPSGSPTPLRPPPGPGGARCSSVPDQRDVDLLHAACAARLGAARGRRADRRPGARRALPPVARGAPRGGPGRRRHALGGVRPGRRARSARRLGRRRRLARRAPCPLSARPRRARAARPRRRCGAARRRARAHRRGAAAGRVRVGQRDRRRPRHRARRHAAGRRAGRERPPARPRPAGPRRPAAVVGVRGGPSRARRWAARAGPDAARGIRAVAVVRRLPGDGPVPPLRGPARPPRPLRHRWPRVGRPRGGELRRGRRRSGRRPQRRSLPDRGGRPRGPRRGSERDARPERWPSGRRDGRTGSRSRRPPGGGRRGGAELSLVRPR